MSTRRHTIRFAAVGLAMSGLMALAACGGDDSGDAEDATTTEATVEDGGDDTATDDTTDTTATDDTATDDTATDDTATDDTATDDTTDTTVDTSDVDALSPEECREVYDTFLGLGFDPTGQDVPEDVDGAFDAIEDAVPENLKEDVDVLREGFETLIEATEQFGDDPTNPEYLEALQALNTPEYTQASERLAAFFENCADAVAD